MAERSAIEWTDATWTPIRARLLSEPARVGWHCEHVSEGCRHCYAEGMNKRLGTGLDFKPGHRRDIEMFLDEKMLVAPLRWRKGRRVFVCSVTDLFADFVTDAMLDAMFAVMARCSQHLFQVLTKRSERLRTYFADLPRRQHDLGCDSGLDFVDFPLPNVSLGVSVEDQRAADARIPDLLATPAAVRFLSCEPLLGAVDLASIDVDGWHEVLPLGAAWLGRDGADEVDQPKIDWVICGGESGRGARPMHPGWARTLRDQCAAAGVPFFFKQWGEFRPYRSELDDFTKNDPTGESGTNGARHVLNQGEQPGPENIVIRVGKNAAGRLLDGVEHNGMPPVQS
jgi:protein gp37